ncbi:glycoside hydrolase family 19 [Acinetobacter sp. LoGeW2-3]|uniref:glycoside hydrolase family 19 protein n=1 Tax=Acinetobacter sp. LoGeW2-3 TaxID=1808001 RepID=UPI000C05BAD5|nr:glycoside hydrolase family 19 [Acinetobacter sp. LoGeW2-3]ATO19277.1 glycoside hydrolase family 19 [Acinetobacter sp. LoGeW2-3]
MSKLVTITSKFYDASGKSCPDLPVKSRYKGSARENPQKTDKDGFFIFPASPNRTIEILAKLSNTKDYQIFRIINSSIKSSLDNPIRIKLPNPGLVTTLFKVVDSQGKAMTNFPVKTRPKGGKDFERLTDEQGFIQVQSSPFRDIEFLVLTSADKFILKKSLNSGSGSQKTILVQLDEPYKMFISKSNIQIIDKTGNSYIVENTKVEILDLQSGKKEIVNTSNGKLLIQSMVGEKIQITVFKPDGESLKPEYYSAKYINNHSIKLKLDVDITSSSTKPNKPEIDKELDENILITMEQMQKMWPRVAIAKMQPILDELNVNLTAYKLDTRLRQAHFIAQVRQEVGANFLLREQVEYMRPAALKKIGYYKYYPKQADIDGYNGKAPANGEVIANRMYDDKYRDKKYKLGNTSLGDGWKYLGRGLKQLTGKNNYQDLTEMYSTIWVDENLDFVKNPKLLEQPKYAVRSAIRFWLKFKLYEIADKGSESKEVDAITSKINRGTDSYLDRRKHFIRARQIFN